MKMLFVCAFEIVDDCLKIASWIQSLIEYLNETDEITLIGEQSYKCGYKKILYSNEKRIECYKFVKKTFNNDFRNILKKIMPNVVVIFGTEKEVSLKALNICIEENIENHTAIFAQGFCTACAKHYADGLPKRIINSCTLRDFIRHDRIKDQVISFEKRAVLEEDILRKTNNFIGRTTFDKAILRSFNETANYYKCNDVLRTPFYMDQWKYSKCERHRLFISQYYYPIKGFHILLEAAAIVAKKFPDVIIAAAGYNPINKDLPKKELKDSSYIHYLKKLIIKYRMKDKVLLLGNLNQEDMKMQYLKANVFVLPSVVENSPNSLAEAMILGVPTVAADVGGVTDFVEHKKEAFIYPSTDPYLLAYYIIRIFNDIDKAKNMGDLSRKRALQEFDKKRNIENFEKICKIIAK